MLLTLPAVAVYLRALLLDQVVGHPGDSLPVWFQLLQQAGIARIEAKTQVVRLAGIGFERDAVLFALPIAAGFPQVVVYLALAGALAAALAALASSLVAIAGILAEDIVYGLPDETAPESARIGTARVAMLGAAFVTTWLAIAAPADPLQLFLWSLTLSAATSFPVLLLAIWVKRTNAWGALAGMITGFVVTVFMMLLSETGAIGLPSALAGSRRPAAGVRRCARRHQADAGARAQCARHRARGARAGRGDHLRPRIAPPAAQEPHSGLISRDCRSVTCLAWPPACNHCSPRRPQAA